MANDVQTNGTTDQTKAAAVPAASNGAAMVPAQRQDAPMTPERAAFELGIRRARVISQTTLVPPEFRGEQGLPNCVIAINLADRIGADPFAVIQNLDVIHGKPSLRSTFLIATVNACKRFSPLRPRYEGKEGTDDWGCRMVAKDEKTGEELVGTKITLKMAREEGWSTKSGSKWKTMPEQMLAYRAAAFWTRLYAPELSLGIRTEDEAIDTYGYTVEEPKTSKQPGNVAALEAALRSTEDPKSSPKLVAESATSRVDDQAKPDPASIESGKGSRKPKTKDQPVDVDPDTGEIVPPNAGDAWEPGQ